MPAASTASAPAARLPRPALSLLFQLGPKTAELTLAEAEALTEKPRSTVTRWLSELVESSVILRSRRDAYVVPSRATLALLLSETSAHARSVLLHHDALSWAGLPHAFACLPVRAAMPFDLENAAPVLDLADPRVLSLDGGSFPLAFRAFRAGEGLGRRAVRFPTAASKVDGAVARTFPVVKPRRALELFAACADARVVQAALAAAVKLGIDPHEVAMGASRLHVEDPPLKHAYPNSLVLPKWLSRFHESSTASLARRYLESARPPSTPAGEDE